MPRQRRLRRRRLGGPQRLDGGRPDGVDVGNRLDDERLVLAHPFAEGDEGRQRDERGVRPRQRLGGRRPVPAVVAFGVDWAEEFFERLRGRRVLDIDPFDLPGLLPVDRRQGLALGLERPAEPTPGVDQPVAQVGRIVERRRQSVVDVGGVVDGDAASPGRDPVLDGRVDERRRDGVVADVAPPVASGG